MTKEISLDVATKLLNVEQQKGIFLMLPTPLHSRQYIFLFRYLMTKICFAGYRKVVSVFKKEDMGSNKKSPIKITYFSICNYTGLENLADALKIYPSCSGSGIRNS